LQRLGFNRFLRGIGARRDLPARALPFYSWHSASTGFPISGFKFDFVAFLSLLKPLALQARPKSSPTTHITAGLPPLTNRSGLSLLLPALSFGDQYRSFIFQNKPILPKALASSYLRLIGGNELLCEFFSTSWVNSEVAKKQVTLADSQPHVFQVRCLYTGA